MTLQEVKNLLIKQKEEGHKLIIETHNYYVKNKLQPYVWLDDQLRLRIKYKYPRTIQNYEELNQERENFYKLTEQYTKENNLAITYIHELGETDQSLPKYPTQWSTEFIIEVYE